MGVPEAAAFANFPTGSNRLTGSESFTTKNASVQPLTSLSSTLIACSAAGNSLPGVTVVTVAGSGGYASTFEVASVSVLRACITSLGATCIKAIHIHRVSLGPKQLMTCSPSLVQHATASS